MSRRCFSYVLLITRTSLLIHFQRWCIISLSSFRFAVFCFGLYLGHFLNRISNCTMSIFPRNLRQTIKAIIIWNFRWFSTNKELDLYFCSSQNIYYLDICINYARTMYVICFLPCKIWRTNTKNRWWSFILDTPEKTSNFRSKIEITIRGNFTHRFTHCAALFCFNKNKQYFTLQKKAVL